LLGRELLDCASDQVSLSVCGWIPISVDGICGSEHHLAIQDQQGAKRMVALVASAAGEGDCLFDELLVRDRRCQTQLKM
jgi:hypothetical protein